MKLAKLIKGLKTVKILNFTDLDVQNIYEDSREVTLNSLFFAVKGNNLDGFDYIDEAIKNGAKVIVTSKEFNSSVTQIIVDDVKLAMSEIAFRFFKPKNKRVKVIGVVGTNGKTTTTYIIKSIFESANIEVGVIGTLGITYKNVFISPELTTPSSINLFRTLMDMSDKGVVYAVMELSAHAIYLNRAKSIKFEALIFTNCTQDHLDFFKTFEEYEKVKLSVFNSQTAKFCVVNVDDATGRKILQNQSLKCYTYGLNNPSDTFSVNVECDIKGSSFIMNIDDELISVDFCLTGNYNVYNCMAASTVCKKLGVKNEDISRGASMMTGVPGRAEFIEEYSGADIFIDYAHTPDGVLNVLKTFKTITDKRLVVVFGCGGNRDSKKRAVMGEVVGKLADFSIITDDNPRYENSMGIISEIETGIKKHTQSYIIIQNRALAIEYAVSMLLEGDVLLVLGKGAEEYQEIMGVKTEFSDKRAILNAINKIKFGKM